MYNKELDMGQYDIAIIGGGPAGLQAALVLARTRKNIIVFDDPQPPRNGASHGVHNFLGLDGLRPAQIREIAWQQINVYQSAELRQERVTNIAKGDDYFYVAGHKGTTIQASHVILAFGYRDIYPNIAGFTDCWADTIISCPFCDGYENRNRVWGVVAVSELHAHHFPKMLKNWTPTIKLLLQPSVVIDAGYRDELLTAGITVHEGAITQIHHTKGKVEGVVLESGEAVEVGTLLWIPPKEPLPLIQNLVGNLGLALDEEGFVKTNEMQQTNVDKLWAVGDVQNGRSGALDAAHTGLMAAFMIIKD
ncbi:MAG: NAD(P)/FAD-dependent oxidoreductase [Anaerolineales bacterium]|nr:NAD(P)/FAD-dependent oxidoreductase [Anaerolineales bacterium]